MKKVLIISCWFALLYDVIFLILFSQTCISVYQVMSAITNNNNYIKVRLLLG